MIARPIDVNCDMGESFGNWGLGDDERLTTVITTAHVACGFHGAGPDSFEAASEVRRALEELDCR